jgi:hypothetical protein
MLMMMMIMKRHEEDDDDNYGHNDDDAYHLSLLSLHFTGDITKWVSYVVCYDAYNTGQ